jgi:hypothetical protein
VNGPTRKKVYSFLVQRDTEYCKLCGVSGKDVQLVIDHIDNNKKNNNVTNLQLLCRRCNYFKNPREPLDLSEREDEGETELQKSKRLRPLIRKFILHEINERTEVPEKDILDGGAEEFSCSQQTIKRILDGMCSFRGVLENIGRARRTTIRYKVDFYSS